MDNQIEIKDIVENSIENFMVRKFNKEVEGEIKELFPRSDLGFQYSKDEGFNLFGALYYEDFLNKWESTEEERKVVGKILEYYNFIDIYENETGFETMKYIEDVESYMYSYFPESLDRYENEKEFMILQNFFLHMLVWLYSFDRLKEWEMNKRIKEGGDIIKWLETKNNLEF